MLNKDLLSLLKNYQGPFRVIPSGTTENAIVDRDNKLILLGTADMPILEMMAEALTEKWASSQIILKAVKDSINTQFTSPTGKCSCYYCQTVMDVSKVVIGEDNETYLCPLCRIDALIPGIIDKKTLGLMHSFWFGENYELAANTLPDD